MGGLPEKLTPTFFLEKMGMANLEQQAPGFAASLNENPRLQAVLSKFQSLPPEEWEAAITKYKPKIAPMVEAAFKNFEKKT